MHTANGELGTKTRKTGMQKGGPETKGYNYSEVKGDSPVERLDTPLRKVKA